MPSAPVNVMALFCEDIREEKGGTNTLVGILSDNINVRIDSSNTENAEGANASTLPKLCIYVRINFDREYDIGQPTTLLIMPNGDEVELGTVSKEVVEKSKEQAKKKDNPLSGVISRVRLSPLRLSAIGLMKVVVVIHEERHLAGILHLREATDSEATPSNGQ